MTVKKLGLKQRYAHMTRGLDWETTYQPMDKVFPYDSFEGIKIKDWSSWEDPFRLTMDSYWKFQAEKERKLYAVLDAFAQSNGQTKISDGRYANVVKLFLTGISPEEYQAHRGFAFVGRHMRGVGPRVAAQMQSLDELRHIQTQIHTISHYNKYFDGIGEFPHMHDRVWYLSVPKSFFDDARTAGPFEFMIAIGFAFEYVLTNLLFVPFMSGAAYNGDLSTVTFGFSAQSDESRHMTLGIEVIKFLLEQHPDNLPIVQKWVDKWFWRGHKVLGIVAMMMDYMLPKKVMSWREAWDIYYHRGRRLAVPGPCPLWSASAEICRTGDIRGRSRLASELGGVLSILPRRRVPYLGARSRAPRLADARNIQPPLTSSIGRAGRCGRRWRSRASASTTWRCPSSARPARSRWPTRSRAIRRRSASATPSSRARPITSARTAAKTSSTTSRRSTSRHGCRCTRSSRAIAAAPTIPDVLAYYRMNVGADNMDYVGSPDEALWNSWQAGSVKAAE